MDLENFRNQLDSLDSELIATLAKRFKVIHEVGEYKKENKINSFQPWRWQEVLNSRKAQARDLWVDPEMIEEIWNIIHKFALKKENSILNN